MSFGEGSDTERTLPPSGVHFARNTFYNTKDTSILKAWDNISGFSFEDNKVSTSVRQPLPAGFQKTVLKPQKLVKSSRASKSEFTSVDMIGIVEAGMYTSTGAPWFPKKNTATTGKSITVNCATAEEIYKQLETKQPVTINLTGANYTLGRPFLIAGKVRFTGNKLRPVTFNTDKILSTFIITANGSLSLSNLTIDGKGVRSTHFISSDSSGYAGHYSLTVNNCLISNLGTELTNLNFIYAYKSMIADSVTIRNSAFLNNQTDWLLMNEEKDDKGYYNAERIVISSNDFKGQKGNLIDIYRGGNDESTLGPNLSFINNRVKNCDTPDNTELIKLTGVQVSEITGNQIKDCNDGGILISYNDGVRADHLFNNNIISGSGPVKQNKFVRAK